MRYLYILVFTFFTQTVFAQFSLPNIIDSTNAAFITNITIVDMDNDNQNDIVVTYFSDSLRWYKNNNLSFTKMPLIATGISTPVHMDIADIDGNGFKDIVVSNRSNTCKVHLIKNLGNGTSWSASLIDDNITLSVPRSFFVDMDNDGDLDIISCHDLAIVIYYNNGSGVFSGRNIVAGQGNINEFYNLVVKDFNGDGFKDFIVHSGLGTEYYKANNNNTYVRQLLNGDLNSLLETCDIDNDGDYEIFYKSNLNANFIDTYKNDGLGSFSLGQSNNFTVGNIQNPPLKFVKINLDNYIDAIYRNISIKGMFLRMNDGAGNLLNPILIDSVYTYTYMNGGDLNNDNKNDIAWTAGVGTNKKYFGYTKNQMTVTAVSNNFIAISKLKIFPNPSTDKILITHSFTSNKHTVQVTDCFGETVFQSNVIPNEINVSAWVSGIYFLKTENYVYKMIKM